MVGFLLQSILLFLCIGVKDALRSSLSPSLSRSSSYSTWFPLMNPRARMINDFQNQNAFSLPLKQNNNILSTYKQIFSLMYSLFSSVTSSTSSTKHLTSSTSVLQSSPSSSSSSILRRSPRYQTSLGFRTSSVEDIDMDELLALKLTDPLPPGSPLKYTVRKARLHELSAIVNLRISVFFPELIDTCALHDTILTKLHARMNSGTIVLIATQDNVEAKTPSTSSSTSSSPSSVMDLESYPIQLSWQTEILQRMKSNMVFEASLLGTLEVSPNDFEGTAMEGVGAQRKLYAADLAIRADARRRGIATSLLKAVEELAVEQDFEEVYLNVEVDNESAKTLYLKNGYQEIPRSDWVVGFTQTRLVKPPEFYIMYFKAITSDKNSIPTQRANNPVGTELKTIADV